jgi:hypothetical protein
LVWRAWILIMRGIERRIDIRLSHRAAELKWRRAFSNSD